ncbi:MAG TPA: DUF1854 domain-containing protein [Gemmatimonadales bacterium]|jgi:hypothetical protein|nr:DUF1854 domain-containing protein [Gemmatimonadales bacterium]
MLALERRADGVLCVTCGSRIQPVLVRPCFPWVESRRYISLRDDEHNEVALIKDPEELDPASRAALEQSLAEAGFLLEVTRVLAVEEEVEIRHWRVETRQGPRSFQTRLDAWPRSLPGGGFLIRDVAGDLYHLAAPAALDRRSRELLWAFVD